MCIIDGLHPPDWLCSCQFLDIVLDVSVKKESSYEEHSVISALHPEMKSVANTTYYIYYLKIPVKKAS